MGTVEALDWLYEKGEEELEQGNLEEARQRFNRILQMTRETKWIEKANAKLSQVYLREDNLFWAKDHIHRAIKRNRNHAEYRYIKGMIHYRRGEWHDAASEAVKAVEEGLESSRYYRLLGKSVYEYDGYHEARRFMDWALECDPKNVDASLDYAKIEIKEGNYRRALQLLKDSLDKNGDDERILESIRTIQENWKITGN